MTGSEWDEKGRRREDEGIKDSEKNRKRKDRKGD